MAELTQLDRIEIQLARIQTRLDRQDEENKFIKERLAFGEEEFRQLKWDIWLGNSAVKQLCILAGAKEHVMALTARQAERFDGATTMTGMAYNPDQHDIPTDPGVGKEPRVTDGSPQ